MGNKKEKKLEGINEEDNAKDIIFTKDNQLYFYVDKRIVRRARGSNEEVTFGDLASAVRIKYDLDIEEPIEDVYSDSLVLLQKIGFKGYADFEVKRLVTFVDRHREEILAREASNNLDACIMRLFDALDAVREADPDKTNSWNILSNDEILPRDRYVKTKKIGAKDEPVEH